jgi:serine/threonine protein kinase/sugar lactone lactonase YvrE
VTEIDAQLAASLSRGFRLLRRLGEGGMGAVFLAEQIAVGNRPVALKVLSRKLLDDPDFLLRFQNEAASTGRIHHPNVVTIYESGQADDGTPYIAMEFLEGESLRQALSRRGALPVAEVAEILQQAARGLNAAHKLGIIHRDLKPDNIFLTYPDDAAAPLVGAHDVGAGLVPALPVGIADTGRAQDPPLPPVVVKLVDFGIAKLRESGAHTQTGMVLGTPAYMSFEQASGMRSDELDARSDVYSLGVVVYEMLTGRTPFQSDTPVGYLRMHMQEDPPPFRTVAPDFSGPGEVEPVVMKALTKNREERHTTALEFGQDFARAASASGQTEASALGPTEVVDTLDSKCSGPERLTSEKAEAARREKEKAAAELAAREEAFHERIARANLKVKRREEEKAARQAGLENVRRERSARAPLKSTNPKPGFLKGCLFMVCAMMIIVGLPAYLTWRRVQAGKALSTLTGHTQRVTSVVFSPDSRYLASGSDDRTIKLWEVATGRQVRTLAGHIYNVTSVAFSPDGRHLASGSWDRTVKLWEVATGNEVRTLTGHADGVSSVAFSPDGRYLASGSWDRTVKLWEVATGSEVRTLIGHTDGVRSVTFSPDGTYVASAGGDNIVMLWGGFTGHASRTLRGHMGSVTSVAFSPDGQYLASASADDTGKLWEVATGREVRTLKGDSRDPSSIAFSPDGRYLASGALDATIQLWDVGSGVRVRTLRGHAAGLNSVMFSPDGRYLASGSDDNTVKLWRASSANMF